MKTEIKITMHNLKEERPQRSGEMICITKYGGLTSINYSYRWDSFNYRDSEESMPDDGYRAEWDDYIVYWGYADSLKGKYVYETE